MYIPQTPREKRMILAKLIAVSSLLAICVTTYLGDTMAMLFAYAGTIAGLYAMAKLHAMNKDE